ncbi:MAG: hypothetical protein ABFE08_16370 [Armatimonadia bacterium]
MNMKGITPMLNENLAAGVRAVPTPHTQRPPGMTEMTEMTETVIRTPEGAYSTRDEVQVAGWYVDDVRVPVAHEDELRTEQWYVDDDGAPIALDGELRVEEWAVDDYGDPIARELDLEWVELYIDSSGKPIGEVDECVEVPAHRGDNCQVCVRRGRSTQTVPATSLASGAQIVGVICPDCGSTVAWRDGAGIVAECECGGLISMASIIARPSANAKAG